MSDVIKARKVLPTIDINKSHIVLNIFWDLQLGFNSKLRGVRQSVSDLIQGIETIQKTSNRINYNFLQGRSRICDLFIQISKEKQNQSSRRKSATDKRNPRISNIKVNPE